MPRKFDRVVRGRLSHEARAAFSRYLFDGRRVKGWSQERTAEAAAGALAAHLAVDKVIPEEERTAMAAVEITWQHVAGLEGCPAFPLGSPERRARVLGIVLALGLDRAKINHLAGGI